MATQRAIVRKKMALEALGAVTNICSDKTGTLTQGKMMVKRLYIPSSGHFSVEGTGYKPAGKVEKISFDGNEEPSPVSLKDIPRPLFRLTQCAGLCNMAIIKRKGVTVEQETQIVLDSGLSTGPGTPRKSPSKINNSHQMAEVELAETNDFDWEAIGDPTEAALQAFAWKLKLGKPHLDSKSTPSAPMSFDLIQEYGFDSTLKRMSVVYKENLIGIFLLPCYRSLFIGDDKTKQYWIFAKGSVESILSCCGGVFDKDGGDRLLEGESLDSFKTEIFEQTEQLASLGLVSFHSVLFFLLPLSVYWHLLCVK